jgi:alpha-glucosidase (family GH31 glycosyl hydrolase)
MVKITHHISVCFARLQIDPYFDYRSQNFTSAVQNNYLVRDAGGTVPGFARVRLGAAWAVLDVSNVAAKTWFKGRVREFQSTLSTFFNFWFRVRIHSVKILLVLV